MLLNNIKFTKERVLEILVEILKDAEGTVIISDKSHQNHTIYS